MQGHKLTWSWPDCQCPVPTRSYDCRRPLPARQRDVVFPIEQPVNLGAACLQQRGHFVFHGFRELPGNHLLDGMWFVGTWRTPSPAAAISHRISNIQHDFLTKPGSL